VTSATPSGANPGPGVTASPAVSASPAASTSPAPSPTVSIQARTANQSICAG
jgi:hypothetical protein